MRASERFLDILQKKAGGHYTTQTQTMHLYKGNPHKTVICLDHQVSCLHHRLWEIEWNIYVVSDNSPLLP